MLDGFVLWRNHPPSGFDATTRGLIGIIQGMISMPKDLPDDPALLSNC
jgi:hypothetical protein